MVAGQVIRLWFEKHIWWFLSRSHHRTKRQRPQLTTRDIPAEQECSGKRFQTTWFPAGWKTQVSNNEGMTHCVLRQFIQDSWSLLTTCPFYISPYPLLYSLLISWRYCFIDNIIHFSFKSVYFIVVIRQILCLWHMLNALDTHSLSAEKETLLLSIFLSAV